MVMIVLGLFEVCLQEALEDPSTVEAWGDLFGVLVSRSDVTSAVKELLEVRTWFP